MERRDTTKFEIDRMRGDAAALVLGALLGVAVASEPLRAHAGPPRTGGVVSELTFAGATHAGQVTPLVGVAVLLGAAIAFLLRRRLAGALGAASVVPFLPALLAPAAIEGALPAWSLLGSGAAVAAGLLIARPRDLDLGAVAFSLGAAQGVAVAMGRVGDPGLLLVAVAVAGAAGLAASAVLARHDEARLPRTLLGLLPLGLGALAPWALGGTYAHPELPDERRWWLATSLAVLGPALAIGLLRTLPEGHERDARARLRRLFVFVVLPLAAAGLSAPLLPPGIDTVHAGERLQAASAVLDGALPFRDEHAIKPLNDFGWTLLGFALHGENAGSLGRVDALVGPVAAGVEALFAVVVLPPRIAALVTALRLAAPLRVLFGPYANSLSPPHRYAPRDLAIIALACALASERPSVRALGFSCALVAIASLAGLDAAAVLTVVVVVGVALRIGPSTVRPILLGVVAPLGAFVLVGAGALASVGALESFVTYHRDAWTGVNLCYAIPFDAATNGDPLALPLRALRLHGPALAALATVVIVARRRRELTARDRAAGLVAIVVLARTPTTMARAVPQRIGPGTHLAPALIAFATWETLRTLAPAAIPAALRLAPALAVALLLGARAPEVLERLAARGVTDARDLVVMRSPRARGVPVEPGAAKAVDALVARLDARPPGSLITFPGNVLVGFLAGRRSPSPFSNDFHWFTRREREVVARSIDEHPPVAVVLVPAPRVVPQEIQCVEVTRRLWARYRPTERVGPYVICEPGTGPVAPGLAAAVEAILPHRDLGWVPATWGREQLVREVGAGAVRTLEGWSATSSGRARTFAGSPLDPSEVGYVRATFAGEGRGAIAFSTVEARELTPWRTFTFNVSGQGCRVLVPVGAFASWHWSGKIDRIVVAGEGAAPLSVEFLGYED